jgi:hypothetical protein
MNFGPFLANILSIRLIRGSTYTRVYTVVFFTLEGINVDMNNVDRMNVDKREELTPHIGRGRQVAPGGEQLNQPVPKIIPTPWSPFNITPLFL